MKQKTPLSRFGAWRVPMLLGALVLLLVAALIVVYHVTSIYTLKDVSLLADGTRVEERYTVKKQKGAYAIFDRSGARMEQNENGVYILHSGNQYTVNEESGAVASYAVVDYDAEGGESLGLGNRVLVFPQIQQKEIYSIKVENAEGAYELYRDASGSFRVRGAENPNISFDAQMISALAVAAGYPVTTRKLSADNAASYGFGAPTATYTVTALAAGNTISPDSTRSYTLEIGDKTLTGDGYYLRLAGRDAVYVASSSLYETTILSPVEALVAADVIIPTTVSTYVMVQDFVLAHATIGGGTTLVSAIDPIVRFDYQDLDVRGNTLMETRPFLCRTELMEGYEINDGNASAVLGLLYELESPTCVKLGLGEGEERIETLRRFGISGEGFYLAYHPLLQDSDGNYGYSDEKVNLLLIGQKTERGTYPVAALYYDMIFEIDQYYLSFLEWEEKEWYSSYVVSENIAFLDELVISSGDESYHFYPDNSLSYAYYIDEEGNYKFPTLSGGTLSLLSNGSFVYTEKTGARYTLRFIDFENEGALFGKDGKPLLSPEVNSNYLFISSPEGGGMLNYTVLKKSVNDLGVEQYKTLTELDNFRYLWKRLLYFTVEGDVDEVQFEKMTGQTVEDYLAARGGDADYVMRYRVSDNAASYLMNAYGYTDSSGKFVKLFPENNQKDVILRFYSYSGQRALMTIELVTEYDADGAPVEHPEKTVGRFYVLNSYLESLVRNAANMVHGELVEDVN